MTGADDIERAVGAAAEALRRAVGDERAENVFAQLSHLWRGGRLSDEAASHAVQAVVDGAYMRSTHDFLGGAWLRMRDRAYRGLERALQRFDDVLKAHPRSDASALLDGVRLAFRDLTPAGALGLASPAFNREAVGWGAKTGRPRARWAACTAAALREAGVPATDVAAVLEAAGLSGDTPKRTGAARPRATSGRTRRRAAARRQRPRRA